MSCSGAWLAVRLNSVLLLMSLAATLLSACGSGGKFVAIAPRRYTRSPQEGPARRQLGRLIAHPQVDRDISWFEPSSSLQLLPCRRAAGPAAPMACFDCRGNQGAAVQAGVRARMMRYWCAFCVTRTASATNSSLEQLGGSGIGSSVRHERGQSVRPKSCRQAVNSSLPPVLSAVVTGSPGVMPGPNPSAHHHGCTREQIAIDRF